MGESEIERGVGRLELPPKLRLERVTARTIGEAIDKASKNGAGADELQEMQVWLNKNRTSETANHWAPTWNFFPNAEDSDGILSLFKGAVRFWPRSFPRDRSWGGLGRVVVKD